MKIKYFPDTDTLYMEFKITEVVETRDLDDNTLIDIDKNGDICGLTLEHAQQRTDFPNVSLEQIVA